MKAFLLAAGHGTRLRPITDSIPKCLVPIKGVSILQIWLELCYREGITEVLLNLHAKSDVVRLALQDYKGPVQISVSEEPVLLGSAGTLLANRKWTGSDREFWILYADVLTNADLKSMLQVHRQHSLAATLGVYEVPDPKRCGIVKVDADWVIQEFIEKPQNPPSNLAFTGLMLGTPELFDFIPEKQPADLGFDVLARAAGGRMLAYLITHYLTDIGTIENYRNAQSTWPGLE